jgi:hypothetical protein
MRNVVGSLLAVLGAAATLVSPWQPWYDGRHGSTFKFWEVFGTGVTGSRSGIMDSVFLVFLVTAVVAVVGVLLRSRLTVGVAGLVAFGFAILWMVRQGQAAGELTVSSGNRGLGAGVADALGGGLLMIIGAVVMTGRPKETAVTDRAAGTRTRTAGAPAAGAAAGTAASARAPESNAIPTNPPTPSAPARPVPPAAPPAANGSTTASPDTPANAPQAPAAPAGRTGTERLSKEEREMLGLDQDEPSQGKQQK